MTLITRAADSSLLLRSIRRLSRESVLCGAIAALLQPSIAHLGGAVRAETAEESVDAIEGLWALVLDSVLIRAAWRLSEVSNAWRNSGTVRIFDRMWDIEPHQRIHLLGWTVLLGTSAMGIVTVIFEGPWPGLSFLLWAVVLAGAVAMVVWPRQVAAAWKEYLDRA